MTIQFELEERKVKLQGLYVGDTSMVEGSKVLKPSSLRKQGWLLQLVSIKDSSK